MSRPAIKMSVGTPGARVVALGVCRPTQVVTNDEFVAIGSSDGWLREKTGIVSRRIAAPDVTVTDLAYAAAADALANAGLAAQQVDLVLVATSSNPRQTPGVAPEVAMRLGIRAAAIDVVAGCAGFCHALALASDAVRGGSARTALVIGAEKLSDGLDPDDRGTRPMFGDGAGAAVVTGAAAPGIGPVAWGSDGSRSEFVTMAPSWAEFAAAPDDGRPYLRLRGKELFLWAAREVVPHARRACELAGIAPADLAAFVPHQANLPLVEFLARALPAGDAVVADDVIRSANTSAASVPLAFHDLITRGLVGSGEPVLLFAFGAGLCFAGQVVACP